MRRRWAPARLRRFAMLHPQVEGLLQRCGRETVDLLLIDVDGDWRRAVVASEEDARLMGRDLGVRLHELWDDPRLARRMDARDRWTANVRLAFLGAQLVWTSERGAQTYMRCQLKTGVARTS